MSQKIIDLTDKKIGELTVLHLVASKMGGAGDMRTAWACRCSCGNRVSMVTRNLIRKRKTPLTCGNHKWNT